MARGIRIVAVAGRGCRAGGFGLLRHVLGLDQPGDDLERAVAADGGDAAGDREVLAPEGGAGLDGALDLVEPRLDAGRLLDQRLGPFVVVHVDEFVVAGAEPVDLGLLLVGRHAGLRPDAAVGGGVAPRGLDHRHGPLPACRQLVGGRPELRHGEFFERHRILEPDAALVVVCEQVAQYLAAGGLVGIRADEPGDRRGARHPLLGQEALHLPRRRAIALAGDLFPDRHLAPAVGGDGEGLEHFEVDLVRPVGVQQLRRGVAEPQPLLDQPLGQAEARGDGGDRLAGLGQLREGRHLVRRVHGDAHDVLGERELGGIVIPGPDLAGHRMAGIEHAVFDQRLHGLEAAAAGDHGETLDAVLTRVVHADDEVLQQAEGGDGGHELGVGLRIGRGLADVLGGEREHGERDLTDERLGPGGDVVHANLPRWCVEMRGSGVGEGLPRPRSYRREPTPPLRLLAALRLRRNATAGRPWDAGSRGSGRAADLPLAAG